MALSDREAADRRASKALGETHTKLAHALAACRGRNEALVFRNGLREGVRDLSARLVEIYAQVDDNPSQTTREELVEAIKHYATAFIKSAVAGRRGQEAAMAAREAHNLIATVEVSTPTEFDLAVYERAKTRGAASREAVPSATASVLVLFLSANPDPNAPLAVEQEENRINRVRNGSKHQAHIRIESLPDVDITEFAKSLRLHEPAIVHFSGHGMEDGSLTMRDHEGATYDMDPRGLARLLALQKASIRLVVLNACFSSELADLLVADIDCVVGMNDAVDDAAAILFSQGFYGALFDGKSVQDAFETSTAVVIARYHEEGDIPVLRARAGVDPRQIHVVR